MSARPQKRKHSYARRRSVDAPELAALPELVRDLLAARGILSSEAAERFLSPDYSAHIHDPFLMKDMDKAVDRLLQAIKAKEKVVVYSDYDADGVSSGVVLHDFFKKIGFSNFSNYFPHRHEEGFGFHKKALEGFAEDGAKLVITADCGVADLETAARAKELGVDLIVTDHHTPHVDASGKEELPEARAVLDPKREGCAYPNKDICGAGVAYKLVQGVLARDRFGLKEGMEKWLLDVVGLATMADMVPLVGENRVFARFGLSVLRKSPRPGLMKLLRGAKVDQRTLTEDDLAFMVVPRINAASRMGSPEDAFKVFVAASEVEADEAARFLEKLNAERKGSAAALSKEAKRRMEEREPSPIIVMGNPSWKPALLGPVANALMEDHGVPAFLWGRAAEGPDGVAVIKGSCRSDGSVSVVEIMRRAAPGTFIAYGGHHASGGFSVSHDKIHGLEAELSSAYESMKKEREAAAARGEAPAEEGSSIEYDRALSMDDVGEDLWRIVDQLSPFGEGNPKPLFYFKGAIVSEARLFGKERNHLEVRFSKSDGSKVSAIGFFMDPSRFSATLEPGRAADLVATIEKSYFKRSPEIRLRIVDLL